MKNTMKYLSVGSLLFTAMSLQANELGEIHSYSEIIQPVERDGTISITVSGVTNDQGILYLPSYEDSSIRTYSTLRGKVEHAPEMTNIHGRDVIAYQFSDSNSQVTLEQTLFVEDVYKTKKAKIKYSKPGGVKKITYEFTNTAPVTIANYSGQLSVPNKTELYGVVEPERSKKKKTFDIRKESGSKIVEIRRKKVASGDEVVFKIRTYTPSPVIKWTLWALVIFLSVAMLWKRRDILSKLETESPTDKVTAN